MRLTCRGKVALAVVLTLVTVWAYGVVDRGYQDCLNRGYSQVVCAE